MFDLIIKNGWVVDGTGNPGFKGTIGVDGETVVVFREDVSDISSCRTIDALGRVVCPGFIDMHAHSGLVILAEPRHEPKVRQGITTELIGIDGNSYAPFKNDDDFLAFVEMNSGLDGNPILPGRWSSVAEYLSMFDEKVAVNIAYMIGNSPLRIAAAGWENRPVVRTQMENMKSLLREGMEEGAYGLSTGLDYPPGSFATTGELIELSKVAARLGGIYHTHLRNTLGDRYLDPPKEALEISRQSGIPCHLTHFYQRVSHPGGARKLIELVEKSRLEDIDVTFDSYPYIFSSTRLSINFPQWAQEGGPENMKAIMSTIAGRDKLRASMFSRGLSYNDIWLTYFKKDHNHRFEGKSVSEVARMMEKDEVDAMCDLLLDEDLQVSYVAPGVNGTTLSEFITHPFSMVGTDALLIGDFPSPRTYGTFPTILGQYVREEKKLRLPDAIRKMTSFPAQRLGIPDRGLLVNGMKADIVIFDLNTIESRASRTEPKQFPIGIEFVLVNGKVVIDNGSHTGMLPGRALRRGRPAT